MSFEKLSSSHVPPNPELFLDTSIHLSKLKGAGFTSRIDWLLSLFQFVGTSSYSKVEFGNVVLASAVYYLGKLKETGSLAATLDHIGNVLVPQLHGRYITWAFNLLVHTDGMSDAEKTERATLSLNRLLKYGTKLVESSCDHLSDGTQCHWARRALDRDGGIPIWKSPVCRRSLKLCKLDEFFTANRSAFESLKQEIDALPPERMTQQLSDFSTVIGNAITDPACLLDYKSGCKKLADAIIAVDSKEFSSMFSQNVKESSVLCQALGQSFYFLPPAENRGIELQIVDLK